MRWLAWIMTPIALVAALWSGDQLRRALEEPLPAAPLQTVLVEPTSLRQDAEPQPPMRWPSLFGVYTAPEPQPPRPPEPEITEPPRPPVPPLSSLGFNLKGVVSNGGVDWAIVSHPTGEKLLRVGDKLSDGIIVLDINANGLTVDNQGETAVLKFLE
jgi:hypothetical protein